ncbi:MAG TPA: hypothetical protein VHB98_06180, partial [Chloroflexota bacterium]|nr:hypothetical protein [Chloroflexota bacterium]
MNQSRYGVLVSLCLLLLLTGGFFVAALFAVRAVKSSVDKAIATATVVVLPPSPSPVPPSPTPHGYKGTKKAHHPISGAAPTATPANSAQIAISTSDTLAGATTTFPESTSRYWCVANLPAVPAGTGIVWKWE